MNKQKVLILGGGFGGVKTALGLAGSSDFEVTLVSDSANFSYHPTLFKTATGGNPTASEISLAEIFVGKNLNLVIDSAQSLDRAKKQIIGKSGKSYSYDSLVVSLGTTTNFFGIKGLEQYAYGIKSQADAQKLRDHIHKQLVDEQKPDLNYVVIGGGPTGVELAGALPDYISQIIKRHKLTAGEVHIDLVEAAPLLVPRMPKSYSEKVAKRLQRLGITLYLGKAVQAETADELEMAEHSIKSHTVVWTAGMANAPFLGANEFVMTDHHKVAVNEFLQSEPNIYVIGDNADTQYSGMAQTALYDAKYLAANLIRQAKGKNLLAYKPKQPDYVIPVGPHWAAVMIGKITFYGWLGWVLRGAADYIGYRDLEPWWKAGKHWIAEAEHKTTCPTCDNK